MSGFHSHYLFFSLAWLAACCCFCSARSNKLIMLITRNVLVEFIGGRKSFYLPSTHHRVQRCVFIYNQQDRTLLTSCYRRRRRQRLTTTMICHHPLHLFHNIHRFCPSIYHSFVSFVRVTVPSLIYCFSFPFYS